MGKLILIYNWKTKNGESFPAYLDSIGVKYRIIDNVDDGKRRLAKWYKIINTLECIKMAIDSLRCAEEDDVIVSMCATPGIFASLLSSKKKKILILNLLCHSTDNPQFLEKFRNYIYSKALNRENVWATCNAIEDVKMYEKLFSIKKKGCILYLPDGIEMDNKNEIRFEKNNSAGIDVFSCGASARDWDTLLKAAEQMPQVKFHIVARKCDLKGKHIGNNVQVECEIPHELYLLRLLQSKIVVLPLNSDVTAGLLVFFDAIKYNKLPIITLTNSTKQFIPQNCIEGLTVPMNDADMLIEKIHTLINAGENTYDFYLTQLKNHVYVNFSSECYCKRLMEMIKRVRL